MWLSICLVVWFAVFPLHIYILFVLSSFTGLFVVNLSSDGTPLPLDKLEILLLFLLLFQPFINFFEWISSFYRVSLDFTYLLERPAPTNWIKDSSLILSNALLACCLVNPHNSLVFSFVIDPLTSIYFEVFHLTTNWRRKFR